MTLIYDGALTEYTAHAVQRMLNKYPNVCEISQVPDGNVFLQWMKDECPLYTTNHEDCMGGSYTREQTLYGLVHKNFGDKDDTVVFIFFKSKNEMDGFNMRFEEVIINKKPFQTVL